MSMRSVLSTMLSMMLFLIALLMGSPAVTGWSGQQPRLAHRGDEVFLTFVRDNTIQVVRSTDGGENFGEPAAVPVDGKLAAGMRRGPRIAVTAKAVLLTGIAGAKGGGADGDVLLYRSTDDGRTWSKAIAINDVSGSAREGMHGMAANSNGVVVITWLDLRERGTRIFAAVSKDHGASWSSDMLVYQSPSGAVCECCHPSAAVAEDGRIAIMFRNHIGENRDMFVARSNDGVTFEPAAKLGQGTWKLEACPMDGGEIAMSGAQATTAWRREDGVFLATAGDGAAERRLGTGRDPAVAVTGKNVDVAWQGADGLVLMRGDATQTVGPGRFPVLLAFDRHTLIASEHDGQVQIRQIPR